MARNRMIKKEFWDDIKLSKVSRDARLTFIGIWNFCDDVGVVRADLIYLKSKIFPYDIIQTQQFKGWISQLQENGFISLFSYKNEEFYYLPNFLKHQVINRPNMSEMFVPKSITDGLKQAFLDASLSDHGLITDQSTLSRKEREREIEEEKEGEGEKKETPPPVNDNFLIGKIMKFFEFNEIANIDKQRDISNFLKCIGISEKTKYFEDQFDAYVEFKELDDSYKHSFRKFLGSHDKLFLDGAWNAENWVKKLESIQTKKQTKPENESRLERLLKLKNGTAS